MLFRSTDVAYNHSISRHCVWDQPRTQFLRSGRCPSEQRRTYTRGVRETKRAGRGGGGRDRRKTKLGSIRRDRGSALNSWAGVKRRRRRRSASMSMTSRHAQFRSEEADHTRRRRGEGNAGREVEAAGRGDGGWVYAEDESKDAATRGLDTET